GQRGVAHNLCRNLGNPSRKSFDIHRFRLPASSVTWLAEPLAAIEQDPALVARQGTNWYNCWRMQTNHQPETLLKPEELQPAVDLAGNLLAQLDRILLGQTELHRLVLVGILSRGHVLLEGVPGVGKTALVKALGQLLGLEFKRVQFTPDLMPGDI